MAKNDSVIVDSIITDKKIEYAVSDNGTAFELFAFEQILKSYDLTKEEISIGWVDGKDDGGIDGFFIFLNGNIVNPAAAIIPPKRGAVIDIWVITCKYKDGFKQEPLNTIIPTIEEIFDFTKNESELQGDYSDEVLKARGCAVQVFQKCAASIPKININLVYACRGDSSEIESNIQGRADQAKRIFEDYFSNAEISMQFFGATELLEAYRKKNVILDLSFNSSLEYMTGARVLLVKLEDYYNFISDEQGNIRRYLFDSNVRDYLNDGRVNDDIAETLQDDTLPDFWWLNNGVTILATKAIPLGMTKMGNSIQLHDVQIVNGLQTTHTIFNQFKSTSIKKKGDCVLIKIIVTDDDECRDLIIQATNNQSPVEIASLNANDKIQRDIEHILERNDLYYERRKNYYKNIGKPQERFVTPILLASACVAIIRKSPALAGTLKTRFMRNPESYSRVFDEKMPIDMWPIIAEIIKAVDLSLSKSKLVAGRSGTRIVGTWRGAVALCLIAQEFKTFAFTQDQLRQFNHKEITDDRVDSIIGELFATASISKSKPQKIINRASSKIDSCCKQFAENNNILDAEIIGKWVVHSGANRKPPRINGNTKVDEEIISKIKNSLSPQPWKPGENKLLREKLGIAQKVFNDALNVLMVRGDIFRQTNGVVYDNTGHIVAIDAERVGTKYKVGDKF